MIECTNKLSKNPREIQIGDVVLFSRSKKDEYEFYQLTDRHQNIPYTGFQKVNPKSDYGTEILKKNIGDKIEHTYHNYTIENFFSPEDALYRLTAADEEKEDLNLATRGDYVLCSRPGGLEVIRWGLITEEDLNVFLIRCFHNPKGINYLPQQFEIGETLPYRCGYSSNPIKVESAISAKTFQKRFGINTTKQKSE